MAILRLKNDATEDLHGGQYDAFTMWVYWWNEAQLFYTESLLSRGSIARKRLAMAEEYRSRAEDLEKRLALILPSYKARVTTEGDDRRAQAIATHGDAR